MKIKKRQPRTIPRVENHDAECRYCGCTERTPCRGGCFWVTPDLCSGCAKPYLAGQAQMCGTVLNLVTRSDEEGVCVTEGLTDDLYRIAKQLSEELAHVTAPAIPDATVDAIAEDAAAVARRDTRPVELVLPKTGIDDDTARRLADRMLEDDRAKHIGKGCRTADLMAAGGGA